MKKVIYTAIFGDYDNLAEPQYVPDGFDFICFTDNRELETPSDSKWKVKYVKPLYSDSTRNARKYKILPHRFLSEYDVSIWIDGSQHIVGDFNDLLVNHLSDRDMACFDHLQCRLDPRGCVYQEAQAILWLGNNDPNKNFKDNPELVVNQVKKYQKEGYPQNNGLITSGVLLRNHNEPTIIEAMELWWEELKYNSKRDQLSFNYVAWKTRLKFNLMDGDIRDNNYTKTVRHK